MDLIDTHCHLADAVFNEDADQVIARAISRGVSAGILVTESQHDFKRAKELQAKFPKWINLAFGVHPIQELETPQCVKLQHWQDAKQEILDSRFQLVAIGEVGLDFTPRFCSEPDSHQVQRAVLCEQVRLAKELNLPLNVHSRSASKPTIELLKSEGATRIQMHAFDGRISTALYGIAAGFYFSIPPSFTLSEQKQLLVKALPLDRLLTETDSPVLGVDKKIRNEPSECSVVVEFIAKVKELDVNSVREILTENTKRLYPNLHTLHTN